METVSLFTRKALLAALAACASMTPCDRPDITVVAANGQICTTSIKLLQQEVAPDDRARFRKSKAKFAVVGADAIGLGDANGLSEVFARVNC